MFTQDFLKQIKDAIYQPYFMEGILTLHKDRVEAGEYRIEIRDYNNGLEVLIPTLSDDEKTQFAEFEELCQAIQKQYALHGFLAGVYAGFRHAFTGAREVDAGYDKYVMNEVMMLPNMKRNQELYQAVVKRNKIYKVLAEGRVKDCNSPLVCISCYWDEMACSAGSIAFYCGYRAAGSITDRFGLMETDYIARTSKLLMLEHSFGYIETVAERDRRLERQQNGTWDIDDETPEDDDDDELLDEE